MRIQESNRGYAKQTIRDDSAKNLQKSENLYKLKSSPFRHMGKKSKKIKSNSFRRSPFKNIK